MLQNTCCSICLSINKRTINIYKTDLQYAYETLANYKIRQDECWMCFICHMRLRQCHQLQQLAVQTRGLIDDIFQNKIKIYGAIESILELSTSQTNIVSTPFHCSYIKQESEGETGAYNDNGIEQDEILENTNAYEVKKEPSIESEDALAGITQELSNMDSIDLQQEGREGRKEAKVPKLIIVNEKRVIDKYVSQSPTIHPVTEIYPDDRGEKILVEQSKERPEIKQEIEDKGIEQDEILENTNDYEVKKEPFIESEDALADITQELWNVDNIDAQQKPKVPKLIIVKLSQSVIDKYVCRTTTHPVTEIYPEDRREKTCGEQSTEHPETKQEIEEEIEVKGIEQDDEQDNTNDCEGRDRASDAQSSCYKKPLSCDVCFKNFASKTKLIEHMRTHTDRKPFSCDICSKKFSRKSNLNEHKITHTSEKPFSCDICSKKFSRKNNLNGHKITHTGQKPFSCDICSKKFTQKVNLNVHKQKHIGEKPFSCDICSKKFAYKSTFKCHLLIHTGEQPFSCDICLKKFCRSNDLKIHQRTHTSQKPFSCDICLKKFANKQTFNSHLLIHTGEQPFSCDICSKKFSRKRNLNEHKITHTSEKPFSCNICLKKFSRKSNLNEHKITHTGEKPFSCDICSKKFSRKSNLNEHILIHTGRRETI